MCDGHKYFHSVLNGFEGGQNALWDQTVNFWESFLAAQSYSVFMHDSTKLSGAIIQNTWVCLIFIKELQVTCMLEVSEEARTMTQGSWLPSLMTYPQNYTSKQEPELPINVFQKWQTNGNIMLFIGTNPGTYLHCCFWFIAYGWNLMLQETQHCCFMSLSFFTMCSVTSQYCVIDKIVKKHV